MDCDQATTTASTSWHESKRSPCSFRTPEEIRLPRLCPIQSFTQTARQPLVLLRPASPATDGDLKLQAAKCLAQPLTNFDDGRPLDVVYLALINRLCAF